MAGFVVGLAHESVAVTSGSSTAYAQCCSYTVEISCTPAPCLPITVKTMWAGGLTWSTTHPTCGTFSITPVGGGFPPCPPGLPPFQYLTINGTSTIIVPNQPVHLVIGGCCFLVDARIISGCLYVKISRC